MKAMLRPALFLFVLLSLLTGVLYPLAVTGLAQVLFPHQANGSMVGVGGKRVGSMLIGQRFFSPGYFWARPSATGTHPNNPEASAGSNLGPTNPALVDAVRERIAALRAADPGNELAVPVDLVTASSSGLDPDISLAAASYQAARVAKARDVPVQRIMALVEQHAQGPWLSIFGEPRVNVLGLNLALDGRAIVKRE